MTGGGLSQRGRVIRAVIYRVEGQMADRLWPCMLSLSFALVCLLASSVCVCVLVCVCVCACVRVCMRVSLCVSSVAILQCGFAKDSFISVKTYCIYTVMNSIVFSESLHYKILHTLS